MMKGQIEKQQFTEVHVSVIRGLEGLRVVSENRKLDVAKIMGKPSKKQPEKEQILKKVKLKISTKSPLDGLLNRIGTALSSGKLQAARADILDAMTSANIYCLNRMNAGWSEIKTSKDLNVVVSSWLRGKPKEHEAKVRELADNLFSLLESDSNEDEPKPNSPALWALHAIWELAQHTPNLVPLLSPSSPAMDSQQAAEQVSVQRVELLLNLVEDSRVLTDGNSVSNAVLSVLYKIAINLTSTTARNPLRQAKLGERCMQLLSKQSHKTLGATCPTAFSTDVLLSLVHNALVNDYSNADRAMFANQNAKYLIALASSAHEISLRQRVLILLKMTLHPDCIQQLCDENKTFLDVKRWSFLFCSLASMLSSHTKSLDLLSKQLVVEIVTAAAACKILGPTLLGYDISQPHHGQNPTQIIGLSVAYHLANALPHLQLLLGEESNKESQSVGQYLVLLVLSGIRGILAVHVELGFAVPASTLMKLWGPILGLSRQSRSYQTPLLLQSQLTTILCMLFLEMALFAFTPELCSSFASIFKEDVLNQMQQNFRPNARKRFFHLLSLMLRILATTPQGCYLIANELGAVSGLVAFFNACCSRQGKLLTAETILCVSSFLSNPDLHNPVQLKAKLSGAKTIYAEEEILWNRAFDMIQHDKLLGLCGILPVPTEHNLRRRSTLDTRLLRKFGKNPPHKSFHSILPATSSTSNPSKVKDPSKSERGFTSLADAQQGEGTEEQEGEEEGPGQWKDLPAPSVCELLQETTVWDMDVDSTLSSLANTIHSLADATEPILTNKLIQAIWSFLRQEECIELMQPYHVKPLLLALQQLMVKDLVCTVNLLQVLYIAFTNQVQVELAKSAIPFFSKLLQIALGLCSKADKDASQTRKEKVFELLDWLLKSLWAMASTGVDMTEQPKLFMLLYCTFQQPGVEKVHRRIAANIVHEHVKYHLDSLVDAMRKGLEPFLLENNNNNQPQDQIHQDAQAPPLAPKAYLLEFVLDCLESGDLLLGGIGALIFSRAHFETEQLLLFEQCGGAQHLLELAWQEKYRHVRLNALFALQTIAKSEPAQANLAAYSILPLFILAERVANPGQETRTLSKGLTTKSMLSAMNSPTPIYNKKDGQGEYAPPPGHGIIVARRRDRRHSLSSVSSAASVAENEDDEHSPNKSALVQGTKAKYAGHCENKLQGETPGASITFESQSFSNQKDECDEFQRQCQLLVSQILDMLASNTKNRTILYQAELLQRNKKARQEYSTFLFPWQSTKSSKDQASSSSHPNGTSNHRGRVALKGGFFQWLDGTFASSDDPHRGPDSDTKHKTTSNVDDNVKEKDDSILLQLKKPAKHLWKASIPKADHPSRHRWSPRAKNIAIRHDLPKVSPENDCTPSDATEPKELESKLASAKVETGLAIYNPSKKQREAWLMQLGICVNQNKVDSKHVKIDIEDRRYTFDNDVRRPLRKLPDSTSQLCLFPHTPGSRVYRDLGMDTYDVDETTSFFLYSTLNRELNLPKGYVAPNPPVIPQVSQDFKKFVNHIGLSFLGALPSHLDSPSCPAPVFPLEDLFYVSNTSPQLSTAVGIQHVDTRDFWDAHGCLLDEPVPLAILSDVLENLMDVTSSATESVQDMRPVPKKKKKANRGKRHRQAIIIQQ